MDCPGYMTAPDESGFEPAYHSAALAETHDALQASKHMDPPVKTVTRPSSSLLETKVP